MANLIRRLSEEPESLTPELEWEPLRAMRELMRWDPFREFERAFMAPERRKFAPDFEVKETAEAFVFCADVPGVKEDDVDISLTGNRITVRGTRRAEVEHREGERYYACERSYGTFVRSFVLPEEADPESATAELASGVLTLTIAKRTEIKTKKISLGKEKEKKTAKA